MKQNLSNKVKEAILTRADEVQANYIHLSILMEQQKMGGYFIVARNRIIDFHADKELLKNHVVFDFIHNDIWLDVEAVKHYKKILLGYIQDEDYDALIHCMECDDEVRKNQNKTIKHNRTKSELELIKSVFWSRKHNDFSYANECMLEIMSRMFLTKFLLNIQKWMTEYSIRQKVYKKIIQAI